MSKAQDTFNKQLPEALVKNPEKAKELGAVIHVIVKGEGGGEWLVNCKHAPYSCVSSGFSYRPDCKLEVSASDFEALMANPAIATTLFFTGKIKVEGALAIVMKLPKLFGL